VRSDQQHAPTLPVQEERVLKMLANSVISSPLMRTGLPQLFLLLLLIAEWAGDPHFGHSLFSQPLSSQPVCCHSVGVARYAAPIGTFPWPGTATTSLSSEEALLLMRAPVSAGPCGKSLCRPPLAYLFMSILC
jgi:hypothetical protein